MDKSPTVLRDWIKLSAREGKFIRYRNYPLMSLGAFYRTFPWEWRVAKTRVTIPYHNHEKNGLTILIFPQSRLNGTPFHSKSCCTLSAMFNFNGHVHTKHLTAISRLSRTARISLSESGGGSPKDASWTELQLQHAQTLNGVAFPSIQICSGRNGTGVCRIDRKGWSRARHFSETDRMQPYHPLLQTP